MEFTKYQALGNDYLVAAQSVEDITTDQVISICKRNHGVGSDGILTWKGNGGNQEFKLRIFNPDGSEAEKSGNGIRIFCKYLFDNNIIKHESFTVDTLGGKTICRIEKDASITVTMGRALFPNRQQKILDFIRPIFEGKAQLYDAVEVNIGNPHCVLFFSEVSRDLATEFGPLIERHDLFEHGTNVQFVAINPPDGADAYIWERGAGYTLSSGSSSCAIAAACVRRGLMPNGVIKVNMPGGELSISVEKDYLVKMNGPACRIARIEAYI